MSQRMVFRVLLFMRQQGPYPDQRKSNTLDGASCLLCKHCARLKAYCDCHARAVKSNSFLNDRDKIK